MHFFPFSPDPMLNKLFLSLLLAAAASNAAHADAPADRGAGQPFEAGLTFQTGKIALPGGIATLDLPPSFRYLGPADAEILLSKGWGNPPGSKTLGMIVPAGIDVVSAASWGVVVTYDEDGHVADDEADSIKYDELLKTIQQELVDANPERQKQGYAAMTLVNWAETPRYDKSSHKLYWAQELRTDGAPVNTLNYNIRVLGRKGVLVLNAVASMDQLAAIREEMKLVTAVSDFTSGNRYTDFNSTTDKVAEYGLAALVAGGVASKLGLFGKLLALLLAFKKLIFIGIAAAGTGIYRFFSGRSASKVNLDK
jgi:uncharacterized membrane-anchored protein